MDGQICFFFLKSSKLIFFFTKFNMARHPAQRPVRNQKPDKSDRIKFDPELVAFEIGPKKEPFLVHKEHACRYVQVFRAAFNNEAFTEGETQVYKMEDTTSDVFRLLIHWLYAQTLDGPIWRIPRPFPQFQNDKERDTAFASMFPDISGDYRNLVGLWILADYLLLPQLQNLAIDELDHLLNTFGCNINFNGVKFIWDETAPDSPLRRYAINELARHFDFRKRSEQIKDQPGEILAALLSAMSQYRDQVLALRPVFKGSPFYHVPVLED